MNLLPGLDLGELRELLVEHNQLLAALLVAVRENTEARRGEQS